jgi:FkbM family methyltransferase
MVIYDFGANNGQNLDYYLSKNLLVVAVEANPILCDTIAKKFHNEISSKKLVILNYCLTDSKSGEFVNFYVHKKRNVLSQFTTPSNEIIDDYEIISVMSKRPSEIINDFGLPYYIKIDLEHYDYNVLNELLTNNIKPKYLSVEMHNIQIIKKLFESKYFQFFNLVKGDTLSIVYPKFKPHSAGPFGFDLVTPWLNENQMVSLIDSIGVGWIDIHASNDENLKLGDLDISNYVTEENIISRIIRIVKRIYINRWG